MVVNPSGGLISKGHPLGASFAFFFLFFLLFFFSHLIFRGLAQATEMCWQLRGECEKRQVENATIAATHNLGLGLFFGGMIFDQN